MIASMFPASSSALRSASQAARSGVMNARWRPGRQVLAGVVYVGQLLHGQVLVDGSGHLVVCNGGVGGGHMRDQIRCRQAGAARSVLAIVRTPAARHSGAAGAGRRVVVGLGDVQFVAQPELLPLDAPPGVQIIRGGDPGMAGRDTVALRLLFSRRLIASRPPVMVRV